MSWPTKYSRVAVAQYQQRPLSEEPSMRVEFGRAIDDAQCVYLSYDGDAFDPPAGSLEDPRILYGPFLKPVDLLIIRRDAIGLFPNAFTAGWLGSLLVDQEVECIAIERRGQVSSWLQVEDSLRKWLPEKVEFVNEAWIRIRGGADLTNIVASLPTAYPFLHRAYRGFSEMYDPRREKSGMAAAARVFLYGVWGAARNSLLLERIAARQAWGPAPKIVDIGGGYGFLALEMAMKGWSAAVVDYDRDKTELGSWLSGSAPRTLPIEFHTMSMEAVPEDGVPVMEPPDAISFFQCLHIADRGRTGDILKAAFVRLAPGGALVVLECLRRSEGSNDNQLAGDELFELMTRNAVVPSLVSMRDGSMLSISDVEHDPDSIAFVAYKPRTA